MALLLFGGCSGDNESNGAESPTPSNASAAFQVEKSGLRLTVPMTWREIAASEFPPAVLNRDPVTVFRRREADNGVFPNIVITTQSIDSNISALEFSRSTRENSSATLLDYEELALNERELSGQLTNVIEFTARSAPDQRRLRFWQTFIIRQNTGYVLTAAASTESSEIVASEIKSIIDNIGIQ